MLEAGTSMYHPGSLDLSIVVARAGTTEGLNALRGVSSNNGGYGKVARGRTREYLSCNAGLNKLAGLDEVGFGLHVCCLSLTFCRTSLEFSSAPHRSQGFDAVTGYIGQKKLDPNHTAAEVPPNETERHIFLPNASDAQVKIEELGTVITLAHKGTPVSAASEGNVWGTYNFPEGGETTKGLPLRASPTEEPIGENTATEWGRPFFVPLTRVQNVKPACFGLGLFDNPSEGNCCGQLPFLRYSLRSRDVLQTANAESFLVRFTDDVWQNPEIAHQFGGNPSALWSSPCVGVDGKNTDGVTGIESGATASGECGSVLQDELPFVFSEAESLDGMCGSPSPRRDKRVLGRRGNFGIHKLDAIFQRLAVICAYLGKITGILNEVVYVMVFLENFFARWSAKDI